MNFPFPAILLLLSLTSKLDEFLYLVKLCQPDWSSFSEILASQISNQIHNVHMQFIKSAIFLD